MTVLPIGQIKKTEFLLFSILAADVLIIILAVVMLSQELRGGRPPRAKAPAAAGHPIVTAVAVRPVPSMKTAVAPAAKLPAPRAPQYAVDLAQAGGEEGAYGGSCSVEIIEDGGGYCKVDYDVAAPSSWCRFARPFPGTSARGCTKLEFSVRGETGDEVFKVVLGGAGEKGGVFAYELFPDRVPCEWRKVSLPLSRFPAVTEAGGEFALVFENNQGMPYQGTVYVRDVRFVE